MSSILASNGMVLATAMAAVSGTVLLLAFRLKQPDSGDFSINHLRPCISSDGKKREKKNKKVHFAEDVMEPSGNGEEFRKRLQSKSFGQNVSTLKDEGVKKKKSEIMRVYQQIDWLCTLECSEIVVFIESHTVDSRLTLFKFSPSFCEMCSFSP